MTTELKPAPPPDGSFCQRVPQYPPYPVGRIESRIWSDWITRVLGNYDCSCAGGKYFGKNDPLCKGTN